jgi:hypothetical protein
VWKRVDGPVLGSSAELKGGHMRVPLDVMPDGLPANPSFYYLGGFEPYTRVWIGAPSLAELGTTLSACNDWTAATAAAITAPVSDGRSSFQQFENCTAARGLWCLELPKP